MRGYMRKMSSSSYVFHIDLSDVLKKSGASSAGEPNNRNQVVIYVNVYGGIYLDRITAL